MPTAGKSLLHSATVSSRMGPSDANIHGNVHGGVILNLIEEAGAVLTTRFCNQANKPQNAQEPCVTALARIEHMDFVSPMHIGELAELTGEILYTSSRSLEVQVTATAEDIIKGERRLVSQARLWYVPLCIADPYKVPLVPRMEYNSPEAEVRGRRAYETQRADRMRKASEPCLSALVANGLNNKANGHHDNGESPPNTVAHSRSYLSFIVGANDVTSLGHCRGGVLLRHMDECAGIVASRHARGPCVTACVDTINFHKKIKQGSLVTVVGQMTFTSSRSLEIEVIVEVEEFRGSSSGHGIQERAVDSFFTFVTIDDKGKARTVPPLVRVSADEERRFLSGECRYQRRKLGRQSQVKQGQTGVSTAL